MLKPEDDLDLVALSDSSGVSVRTIRFYQQQGLLDSPGVRGPRAKYGESDLNRIRLIKALQRDHLPLSEIRRKLETLDDEGLAEALRQRAGTRKSAVSYARAIRLAEPNPSLNPSKNSPTNAPSKQDPRARSTWERVTLAPDIELHVRRPLSRSENKLVDQLIDLAKRFLNHEEGV